MPTFTFITNFRGGTYTFQKEAPALPAALLEWKESVVADEYIEHLSIEGFKKAFHDWADELPPHPLNGLVNAWGFDLSIGKDLLELYIVQTDTAMAQSGREVKHRV